MLPITLGFVSLLINIPLRGDVSFFKQLRKLSIMIYLIHMIMVFLFLKYFQLGDIRLFLSVSLSSLLCLLFLLYISNYRPFKFINLAF